MREGVEFAALGLLPPFNIQLSLYIAVVGQLESAACILGCQIFIRLLYLGTASINGIQHA